MSVVRKGDGENVLIGFNKIKGISINKYLKKLKHFNIRKLDFKFQNFLKKLIESFMNADYLGIAKTIHIVVLENLIMKSQNIIN